jgi:hypothetical protein
MADANRYRDYFAELHVAGRLADADWNVYFPHRDKGFDFIIAKKIGDRIIVRPVQVKGKYPTVGKTDKANFGINTKFSQTHPEMVLAIPYFSPGSKESPLHIAFMPFCRLKKSKRGLKCEPANFKNGLPIPKRDSKHFFDEIGIQQLEREDWANAGISGTND